jgi:hypothetical protein
VREAVAQPQRLLHLAQPVPGRRGPNHLRARSHVFTI